MKTRKKEKMTVVNGQTSEFKVKDVPIENQRPLKVVVIGAGFSGILAAIRYARGRGRRKEEERRV